MGGGGVLGPAYRAFVLGRPGPLAWGVLSFLSYTIQASSVNLFLPIAEAERVLWHVMMFVTVFFHWMYKMNYSCHQDSSVIHGWFIYWVFG